MCHSRFINSLKISSSYICKTEGLVVLKKENRHFEDAQSGLREINFSNRITTFERFALNQV